MSSQSAVLVQNLFLTAPQTPPFASTHKFAGEVSLFKPKDKCITGSLSLKCNAIRKPHAQGMVEIVQDELSDYKELVNKKDDRAMEIRKHVDTVRSILNSMGDGEISTSPYDVAWVAMVKNVNGTNTPQFPSSLEWIINNQLEDGSWGDKYFFSTYDRILNTLACIVALKTWNVSREKFEIGLSFIRDNMWKLEEEKAEHMPIGYEIVFPSLLEKADQMGIEVPNDSPAIKEIYYHRDLKFKKIPKEVLHSVPTGLLYSLEGLQDLDWEKLLKLQFEDGSFFWCPSSTAYAFMQTNDDKCLKFLNYVVEKFNGAVPNICPVDTFEHIWALDRLQRLGISRYFEPEMKERVAYIHRYWNEKGLGSGRNAPVPDVDDTAMGFRLLRLHGYDVSPDAFKQFEKGDGFVCMAGQSSQAVTGLFNLYRAAQCLHPGEIIFEKAKKFCSNFLREKRASNQLYDKWIVSKDLPGEVGYALDVPWYASLPRLESRFYLEHYGGEDDVWIGKVLYRMYYVNNDTYLELAKLDFNQCQELHQLEWNKIQKWWMHNYLQEFGISKETLLSTYFLAGASIFEPERSVERMAWAKAAVLVKAIAYYFSKETSIKQRRAFLLEFGYGASGGRYKKINGSSSNLSKTGMELLGLLLKTLNQLSLDAQDRHGSDIRQLLHHTWEMWLTKNLVEEDGYQGEAELMVDVINLCSGRSINEEVLSHPLYKHLARLTNSISHQLSPFHKHKARNGNYCPENDTDVSCIVEPDMQELAQLVFQNSINEDIDSEIKRTFLTVARSFYYAAFYDPSTIDSHIAKVLFERVVV